MQYHIFTRQVATVTIVALFASSGLAGGGGPGGGGSGGVGSGGVGPSDRIDRNQVREARTSGGGNAGNLRDSGSGKGGQSVRDASRSGGDGSSGRSGGSSSSRYSHGGSGPSSGGSGSSGSSGSGGSGGSSGSGSGGNGSSGSSGGSGSNSGSTSGSGNSVSGGGSSGPGGGPGSSGGNADVVEISSDAASTRGLAAREQPDFDERGFAARRGEVVSIDLSPRDIKRARSMGFDVIENVRLKSLDVHMVRLRAPEGMTAGEAVSALRRNGKSDSYDYDHYYGVSGEQDRMDNAAPVLQKSPAKSTRTLLVGMIDTSVASHPALRSVLVESQNFAQPVSEAEPFPNAHGTAVASILAAYGASRVISANIFSNDPRPYASADGIARAIDWMVGRGVPVINISIAGPPNRLVDRVISAATAKGHLIVAAAGNGGPAALPAYPAASPGAIAVTAVDHDGQAYLHANRGDYITIAATGVAVPAAAPDGTFKTFTGTSFAAPAVTVHLASCMSQGMKRAQICVTQMERNAHDLGAVGRDPVYGYGLLAQ